MNSFNPQYWVTRAFISLRQNRFQLGVGELFAARQAVKGGFGEDETALAETLKLLWCHSRSEQSQFDSIWDSIRESLGVISPSKRTENSVSEKPKSKPDQEQLKVSQKLLQSPPQEVVTESKPKPDWSSLPVRAPSTFVENEDTSSLQTYYPISRRSMVYNWRYLRRPIADGSMDQLDEAATVKQATRQGFYLAPVYRRREQNHAHLLLVLDQNGSMTPFHRFTSDLVETAQYDSTLQPEKVNVFYFHNVPAASVYKDLYLTEPIPLQTLFTICDQETSVLIVSDAGAARGYRKLERIRATTSFLFKLKQHTTLLAWLNPMPEDRWLGSSAEIIANLVPMYQMDNDGLSNAIDIVRGQPLQHLHSP
ncbi:MAG: VWA containing CoxE family protein [Moorea sp. SIO2I5]|nr:VWA containing CoxE family protein [Moorena sp. SIO2I5]